MKTVSGILSLLVALGVTGAAQNTEVARSADVATIDRSQRYTVTSATTKTSYLVDVLRVDSTVAPVPADYRLPVIYVVDGNSLFPLAAHMANVIVSFSKELPAVLVVSIGYPLDSPRSRGEALKERPAWRTRDLVPPAGSTSSSASAGSAADFLNFINEDLRSFIGARYPVNSDDRTLAGHSLGGLFTMYAFLNSPRPFARYVAISPSLFWDGHALLTQARTLAARTGTVQARLFLAVGGLETKERMGQDMIGDAERFVSILKGQNITGLEVGFHVFPDENHVSVVPGALMRGLTQVRALR